MNAYLATHKRVARKACSGWAKSITFFEEGKEYENVYMKCHLQYECLREEHFEELSSLMLSPDPFGNAGTGPLMLATLTVRLQRMLDESEGLTSQNLSFNYIVRDAVGTMIGYVGAIVHDQAAEVSYVFGSQYWGRSYAQAVVHWLHFELESLGVVAAFWATTDPSNVRAKFLFLSCGYRTASMPEFPLYTCAAGDLVFFFGKPSQ